MSDSRVTGTGSSEGLIDPRWERAACGVGFVAHIRGAASREIVVDGLGVLSRLAHRAACGADPETGDGAGLLTQVPERFFARVAAEAGVELPRARRYAVGQVFLPPEPAARAACEAVIEAEVRSAGQRLLGWRDVPVEPRWVGPLARAVLPTFRQLFVGRRRLVPTAFERALFVIRKRIENRIREARLDPTGTFHIASLSAETIVYKGLLLPDRLARFYPDLQAGDFCSALALVHSRFSTNTFPTWDLAQPLRYVAHNGEINTLQGNRNWTNARRSLWQSAKFPGGLDALFPIVVPGKSDSAQFDNMLELLYLGGRALPHAMMMMIPEAWEDNPEMDPARQAFYQYAGSLMEPWDGPAAIAFTDGHRIGATLDRNGLRPLRWLITDDDRVVLASEAGVLDVPVERIRARGRLRPGRMFVVDTEEGRIISDDEVKRDISQRWPYHRWLEKNVLGPDDLPPAPPPARLAGPELRLRLRAFGYTDEEVEGTIVPMATEGHEPVASMGNDAPIAALSDQAPSLFSYFHQLFAQVTNPAIDPIREALVMSVTTSLGPDGNTFDETPEQCHSLSLPGPIVTSAFLARLRDAEVGVFEARTLEAVYLLDEGAPVLGEALEALCKQAVEAVEEGASLLIVSDRAADARRAPIPSLLALSAVHQHLVREGIRMQTGLIVETGEAREVHHFAALIGFGAAVVNPYLVFDFIAERALDGTVPQWEVTIQEAERHYIHAVEQGLLKVMSKMGISTLHSYRGAQIFEALGLRAELIDRHFTGTPRRLGGLGLEDLHAEVATRHARGYGPEAALDPLALPLGGEHRWRRRGERHAWNPATVSLLQAAVRTRDRAAFDRYQAAVDALDEDPHHLRDLITCVAGAPVPLDEVEPISALCRRFVTGAMSFGSISAEAHETLAIAMNRIGGRSNSGEGGEEPHRSTPDANGDLRRSAIKQVASGRFGVTTSYLVDADDLQIKISQGAKPGEGGQLPGFKIDARIAKVRCSVPGVTLISPPPHHDIYSIEDLKQLIYDLRQVNPTARISVKLVSEVGVGTVAAGVVKAGADVVVIAGGSGGTGAAPLSSIKRAGVPWELGIAEAQQVLVHNDLRRHVRLQVDGGLRTARDVLIAALLGAEEFGFATSALIAEGCIMLRKCHLNTCSVGIATQDPRLRERFAGRADDVVAFFEMLAESIREQMAALGFRTLDEMIGRVESLRVRTDVTHWKARRLDVNPLLARPPVDPSRPRYFQSARDGADPAHLDLRLMTEAAEALSGRGSQTLHREVRNADRAVGARLSGEIARRHGAVGLPDGALHLHLTGSAGQSLGAFLAPGVTFTLSGEANDAVGKGLCGGRIAIRPPLRAQFVAEENVIIGNTALYGATAGELFVCGLAGERFAVRNSGARAVVEGVGDHGCEYMTGGVVVVLGPTGRNFAAGMSGGVAFVHDRDRRLHTRCNREQVDLESVVDESDLWLLFSLLEDHVRLTDSRLGQRLLDNWEVVVPRFVKVMPHDYKRALQARRAARRPTRPVAEVG